MNELNVGDSTYSIPHGSYRDGWHFSKLATPNDTLRKDHAYKQLVKTEMLKIFDICTHMANGPTNFETITVPEVKEAISSLNKNKAADIYGIVAEHILRSKVVVLLLLTFCLLLLPLWESVTVLCFVVRYFMSILLLQSS